MPLLYHVYEAQHAAVAPIRMAADQVQFWLRHPNNPVSYTVPGRALAAGCDVFEQVTRRYGKPKFGLTQTTLPDGMVVEVEEHDVARPVFGHLKHFRRLIPANLDRPADPKLLVVAPLSGHYATLLRGTVEAMLPDHDVYITDWQDARDIPMHEGRFDLDDYIDYLIEFLAQLGPDTHMLAVCQPAVPALAATAIMSAERHPATPASLTMMGGPIDTRESPTEVNTFAKSKPLGWFERRVITRVPFPNPGFMRRVYPGFLQLTGFMAMNLEKHVQAHWEMFQHLSRGDDESANKRREFYEEYRSVMDMTAEFYLQTIKTVFHDHALPKGTMVSRGRPVDLSKIDSTAVLCVEGELDDISGVGQTKAALPLMGNLPDTLKRYHLQADVGHYGIFNGRKWR